MQPVKEEPKFIYQGTSQDIMLPDGRIVTVRETDGDDDDLLSRLGDVLTGENIFHLLASITLNDQLLGRRPTIEDIKAWPSNNKLYLVFKQRLMNHGNVLKFHHTCQADSCSDYINSVAREYNDDLEQFDGDLANEEWESKNLFAIRKYKKGATESVEFKTASGKELRFKILTSILEKKGLETNEDNTSRNTKLVVRELEIKVKEKWLRVHKFNIFSSKEASEVRAKVIEYDNPFEPVIKFKCVNCKQPYQLPLFSIPTFYFPEDMI